MQQSAPDERLSEYYCVTVILRLVLNDRGRVTYGEFLDVTNAHHISFSGWRGMLRAGRTWLRQHQQAAAGEPQNYRDSHRPDE